MKIWHINQSDGTPVSLDGSDAPKDPMRGTYKIPKGATEIEPPSYGENEVPRWDGTSWNIVVDLRGSTYWDKEGNSHVIDSVGEEFPEDAIHEERPSRFHEWNGSNWIKNEILELQSRREGMVVSKFQAKAALKQAGLLNQVQAHIATLPEDDLTRIAWEDAQEFRRLSPTIDAVTSTLNLTDTQVDDLFEQAKYIEA